MHLSLPTNNSILVPPICNTPFTPYTDQQQVVHGFIYHIIYSRKFLQVQSFMEMPPDPPEEIFVAHGVHPQFRPYAMCQYTCIPIQPYTYTYTAYDIAMKNFPLYSTKVHCWNYQMGSVIAIRHWSESYTLDGQTMLIRICMCLLSYASGRKVAYKTYIHALAVLLLSTIYAILY